MTWQSRGIPRCDFTSQLCAVGVTYLRFGTRDQSVRSKDLIASVPDGRGNTTGPIGPAASLDPLLSSAHRDLL